MDIHLGPSFECFAEGAFLPPSENIEELMKQAEPVPILAGITSKEGYMIYCSKQFYTLLLKKLLYKNITKKCVSFQHITRIGIWIGSEKTKILFIFCQWIDGKKRLRVSFTIE